MTTHLYIYIIGVDPGGGGVNPFRGPPNFIEREKNVARKHRVLGETSKFITAGCSIQKLCKAFSI